MENRCKMKYFTLHLMEHEVDKKSIRYEQEIYRVRTKA
jgi:hypothetical protein